jgi:hypothetical protein
LTSFSRAISGVAKGAARRTLHGAELLFEIFSQRHERGSTIVPSNLPFDEWTSVFGSQRLIGALLDRLTHHFHILELNGESYRLKQSKARRRRDPVRNPQPSIPKPAKSPPLPESRIRPGCETLTISAGADAGVELYDSAIGLVLLRPMAGFYCGVDTQSQALRFDERIS